MPIDKRGGTGLRWSGPCGLRTGLEAQLETAACSDDRRIRVLVVDDSAVFRKRLSLLLRGEGFDVVAEAADGVEAVSRATFDRPDVVLMDIHMPRLNGIEATREIMARRLPTNVVILTISAEEQDVVEAVRAGARGYLLKDAPFGHIAEAITAASSGGCLISPSVAAQLLDRMRIRDGAADLEDAMPDLTERELDVLRLLAAGKDNAEIARTLFLSEKTVKNYVSAILRKLGFENRTEAAVFAVRNGIA